MDKIKIFIDPGHQPSNVNHGPTGFKEWEGNLKRALYLEQFLLNTEQFEVKLSHRGERKPYRGVRERGHMAAKWKANLIISLHTNAGGGTGTEVFYSVDIPADKKWAQLLSKMIAEEFDVKNRGAKLKYSGVKKREDWSGVLDAAQDGGVKHAFLSESLFHDNAFEEKLLKKESTQKKLAEIHAIVFCKIFGVDERLIYIEKEEVKNSIMINYKYSAKGRINEDCSLFDMSNMKTLRTLSKGSDFDIYKIYGVNGKLYAATYYSGYSDTDDKDNVVELKYVEIINEVDKIKEELDQYKVRLAQEEEEKRKLKKMLAKINKELNILMAKIKDLEN